MRLWVPLHQPPEVTDDEVAAQLPLRDEHGRRWRGGIAKFFIDGVVEPGTSWLYDPDTAGGGTDPFWPSEERYAEVVGRFIGAGFQVATHAVGDRAVRAALDAYQAGAPPTGHHRIEHIETLQDHDLPRFAAEGVAASMQPLHMENMSGDRSDPWSRMLGPARCDRAFRTRDLADSGAIVALGSDWPVARFDPRRGMGWARLRRAPAEPELTPYLAGQALTPIETLHGYTTAPARIVGEADRAGIIRPGYRGDLSAFAADPVEIDADALLDLEVTLTVVDGEVVHHA
jgi:predicted amidohydrolase YtcJ